MQRYSKTIDHFSHHHSLNLTSTGQHGHADPPICSACKTRSSGSTYMCGRRCEFFLHAHCALLPRVITHPGHFKAHHQLQLLTNPAHASGSFRCDGCGHPGDGFSYRCTSPGCDFDIHGICASKPLIATHRFHAHQLNLTFHPPYKNGAFRCNICGNSGSNHWLYRCAWCNFDAHLSCVDTAENLSAYQSSYRAQPRQQRSMVPAGIGASPPVYVLGAQGTGPGRINYAQPAATTALGGGLMASVADGLAQGVAQQEAQYFVQNSMGGNTDVGSSSDAATSFDFSSFLDLF